MRSVISYAVIVVISGLGLVGAFGRVADRPPAQVDWIERGVAGLPLPVRLVAHGPATVTRARMPDDAMPIAMRLTSTTRTLDVPERDYALVPTPRRPLGTDYEVEEVPHEVVDIAQGGQCEVLWDLNCVFMKEPGGEVSMGHKLLTVGDYAVTVSSPSLAVASAQNRLVVVAPNAAEQLLLEQMNARARSREVWLSVFIVKFPEVMDGIDPAQLSVAARQQLQWPTLLARLVHDPAALPNLQIRPEETAGLWPGFQTEVWMLEYELRLARNDQAGAATLRDQILARRPLTEPLLEHIRNGGGAIASYRRQIGR